jgi:creatinine amidohydrolase
MPLLLETTPGAKLAALPRERTVFFFPVGPIEDHGPHLPVGLDLFEAEKLCELAAARLEREQPGWVGVIMPRAPLGIDSDTTAFRLTVRGHVLRDWLVDGCLGLGKLGFRHFVAFSGHPGPKQLTAIEEAGKIVRRRAGAGWLRKLGGRGPAPALVSASSALTSLADMKKAPFAPDPVEHGGRRDTSVALEAAREFVDPAFAQLPALARVEPRGRRRRLRRQGGLGGYWGEPAGATVDEGRRILESALDEIFPKLRAVWAGADPKMLFRSWYSLLWPNRSFFKAWVLFYLFVALMAVWIYLTFTTVVQV